MEAIQMELIARLAKTALAHGVGLGGAAVIAEALDEAIIPGVLALLGHPALAGVAILADLDWLTIPLMFIAGAGYRRLRGGRP